MRYSEKVGFELGVELGLRGQEWQWLLEKVPLLKLLINQLIYLTKLNCFNF